MADETPLYKKTLKLVKKGPKWPTQKDNNKAVRKAAEQKNVK